MSGLLSGYAWVMLGLCVWVMFGICVGLCFDHVWVMFEFGWVMYVLCLGYDWDIFGGCVGCCIGYVWNTVGMCLNYDRVMFRFCCVGCVLN